MTTMLCKQLGLVRRLMARSFSDFLKNIIDTFRIVAVITNVIKFYHLVDSQDESVFSNYMLPW